MEEITDVSIIGAGSWGTTWAKILGEEGFHVKLWVREGELLEILRERDINEFFLPGYKLEGNVEYLGEPQEALASTQIVMNAVPTQYIKSVWKGLSVTEKIVINLSKGIELDSLEFPIDIISSATRDEPMSFINLSGPSFAKEVAQKVPTILVSASENSEHSKLIQELFSNDYLRIYGTEDVTGAQLGGALKNVMAIACGISDGLGLGHNTRAALMTRGLAEIGRLAIEIGGKLQTMFGVAGFGDLTLTCTSNLSRNYSLGYEIGAGKSLREIRESTNSVAEGVDTAPAALELSRKYGVSLPIIQEVYNILYENKALKKAVSDLMKRPLKFEWERIV